jgi:hypothetical protein
VKEERAGVAAFTEVVGKRPEEVRVEWWTWAKGSMLVPQ